MFNSYTTYKLSIFQVETLKEKLRKMPGSNCTIIPVMVDPDQVRNNDKHCGLGQS